VEANSSMRGLQKQLQLDPILTLCPTSASFATILRSDELNRLGLDQPEHYSGWVLTDTAKQKSSSRKAWSNQRIQGCCIDRLSRQG
jgi:hypothetical protein